MGDQVRPFCVSGGLPRWLGVAYDASVPPVEEDGMQLLCSFYVGVGAVGFVKLIKACPYKPSLLHNSAYAELVPAGEDPDIDPASTRPDSDAGFWTTPFGWEAYQPTDGTAPFWQWYLRFFPGTLENIRNPRNAAPFAFTDPQSWAYIPSIPVPSFAYQTGLPGYSPSGWGAQRMQWFGKEAGEVHIPVPEDCTVALFARWAQSPYSPESFGLNGSGISDYPAQVYPLGPSFGQLVGYTQPLARQAASRNAKFGWAS